MVEATSPSVVVSVAAALAAVGLAARGGFSHWTVPSLGPWAVAGGAVVVAARAGAYDSLREPVSAGLLLSAVAVLAAASWVVLGRVAAGRGGRHRERYLAAAGIGLAAVLVVALLGHAGVSSRGLIWVLVAPIAAATLATAGFLALGFVVTDLLTDLRLTGLYTVGTVVFEGAASVAASELFGAAPAGILGRALRPAFAAADVAPSWPAVVAGHLVVALAVVGVCGRVARWRSAAGRSAVLVVSVVALWSGSAILLEAVTLG